MKKFIAVLLILVMLLTVAGCRTGGMTVGEKEQQQAEASGLSLHKIGVATYNVKDAQVQMFKNYLDKYIKECFVDVTFLYSESIGSGEDMMNFLQTCADNGCEGIMLFYTNDLKKEVEFCASKGMYVIRASGNASDAEFQSVADNPYFLGEIGPGTEAEIEAAENMTHAMAAKGDGKSFVILSGGAFMGNAMHLARTVSFLNCLQEIYGVQFGKSSSELAMVSEATEVEAGELKVIICPGYMEIPQFGEAASNAIVSGKYTDVLATIPVTPLMDALNASDVTCGTTDCFSEDNYFGFKKGKISYVAGKYQSEIGPAFAALFNAVTGNAEAYRENGKAFRLQQGFWTAANSEEYDVQYALAGGAVINAYNYQDLYDVIISLTPEATYEDFKALVAAWTYDDCVARRSK